MRLVLGPSLTASSAVWVLVDTVNGKILAEEVVALDSLHKIARAAARSVQAFDVQTEHDIEGVRLTWSEDAREQGIRLRTKLRLFGFETAGVPATTAVQPEAVALPEVVTEVELDSTVPETIPVSIEVPHLPAPQPAAVPVRQPVTVAPQYVLPPPLPPVLSSLFGALP